MNEELFRKRIKILLIIFGVWALLAAGRLFYFTVIQQDRLKKESRQLAWREAEIPVIRGRILSADGVPLAWSNASCSLYLENWPIRTKRKEFLLDFLRSQYSVLLSGDEKTPVRILHREPMERFPGISDEISGIPELRCSVTMDRKRVESERIRQLLGECKHDLSGSLAAVSGLELKYEETLRGKDGKFRVMLNRHGNWMENTLRILIDPVQGSDVYLPETFEALQKESGHAE